MKKKVRFAPPASPPDSSFTSSKHQRPIAAAAAATARYSVQTDVIDEIKPASSMTDSERSSSYWQLKDYEYFRGTAQIIASEVLKVTASQPPSSHSYNAVLTRAYDLCAVLSESSYSPSSSSSSSSSSIETREEKDDAAVAAAARIINESNDQTVLPPHLFAALTHWVKAGHSRRGLEKFCVTSHVRTRPMAKSAIVQAVLLTQDLLRQQQSKKMASSLSPSTPAKPNNQKQPTKFHIGTSEFPLENLPQDEILRLVSERFSKTSRYFGTAIGQADAAAVGNYQHPIQK